jgi:hypothetical protein
LNLGDSLSKASGLPGSLQREWKRCGKTNCRCARVALHGPYWSRRWREAGRQRRAYVPRDRIAEAWAATCEQSRKEYHSGRFLIERLGAARFLDPKLMATLWALRQPLLADVGPRVTAAEQMLVDLTELAYYNALRVQGWIGNLALHIEHELLGQGAPSAKLKAQYGPVERLAVEDRLKRLEEQFLPLLDRANRMMVRNLKAIKQLRQGPTPAVAIGRAEQVNAAERQANAVVKG